MPYIIEYFLPLFSFSIAAVGSFTIPPLEGNDRTCMLITLFLVNVQMSLYISDNSPSTSTNTALDVFVTGSIQFVFLAIVEYLVILFLLSRKRLEKYSDEYYDVMEKVRILDRYSLVVFPILLFLLYLTYFFYYIASPNIDIHANAMENELWKTIFAMEVK